MTKRVGGEPKRGGAAIPSAEINEGKMWVPWRKRTAEDDTRSGVVPVYDGVEYVLEVT